MSEITMRAKFIVSGILSHDEGGEDITMRAVGKNEKYDKDGLDENSTFSIFTPSADLVMSVNNPALSGKISLNQEYYVDFTPAV